MGTSKKTFDVGDFVVGLTPKDTFGIVLRKVGDYERFVYWFRCRDDVGVCYYEFVKDLEECWKRWRKK
jgi:hypothetical protein